MTTKSPETPPSSWDTEYEPYAKAVGFLTREWNMMQEALCDLFCTVLDPEAGLHMLPIKKEVAERLAPVYEAHRAVWYAVQNDRLQRALLTAATAKMLPGRFSEEVNWVVEKADKLGQQRDDAVHSPVSMMIGNPIEFVALHFHGHPRAKKLEGKKLLEEFERYRQRAAILRKQASALDHYVRDYRRSPVAPPPLPKKPDWPSDPQKNPQVKSPRSTPAK